MEHDKHRVTGTYMRQTERGLLLNIEGEEVWMPKSQINKIAPDGECEEGCDVEVEVPEWLAKEKGLIE